MNNKAPELKLDCTITALIPGNPDGKLNTLIYWEEFIFTEFEDVIRLLALGTALASIAAECKRLLTTFSWKTYLHLESEVKIFSGQKKQSIMLHYGAALTMSSIWQRRIT